MMIHRRTKILELIDSILSDRVLGILALVMALLVIVELSVEVGPLSRILIRSIDWAIVLIFAMSLATRFTLSDSKRNFFRSSWNILDLIIVIFPFVGLLPLVPAFVVYAPVLRLCRTVRMLRPVVMGIRIANALPNTIVVQIPPELAENWRKLCELHRASEDDLVLEMIRSELERRFRAERDAHERIRKAAEEIHRTLGKDRLEKFSREIELLAKKLIEQSGG